MRKTVYVILALCCFIIKTYSINRPYYHFKQLSIKEGLPTSITSLYDDKNGSLWVGTTQGIYRFNGEKIKKYINPEKPDVPLNKNDAFQKVQKRRVQEKR